ncbi:MAG: hypothetical protein GQ533_08445 [Methanosarcinaceae archaeon]|jgi:hypothetical protein|nr:hypothetical protein [Methanosarcinaceae archaeon]
MTMNDYYLFYKIKKYWGITRLIGTKGLDFWIAVTVTSSFLLLYILKIIDLNWRDGTLSYSTLLISSISLSLALIGLLYTYRSKFNQDNDFNTWLIKKDVIDELELLIDYPLFVIVISIIVSVSYGILLIMFKISNETMAIIFAIPIFFVTYGYAGFIYAMKTISYYSHASNKFKKQVMIKHRGEK